MNLGEYFMINSIEELKQVYHMFKAKWGRYSLEDEIEYFNKGYRCVLCGTFGIFLTDDMRISNCKEIKSPIRNINNLNKFI